jgi:hypothetical protein
MAVSIPQADESRLVEFAPALELPQLGEGVIWQDGQKHPSLGYISEQLDYTRIQPSVVSINAPGVRDEQWSSPAPPQAFGRPDGSAIAAAPFNLARNAARSIA